MSEMVKNKGIIKELYPNIENPEEKIIYLHNDTEIPFDELVGFYNDEPDWDWINHDDYSMILNRLFDVSNVPDSYDDDGERYDVVSLGNGNYEIDLYYYNGGTNMEELIAEHLEKEEAGDVKPKMQFFAIEFEGNILAGQTGIAGPTYQGPTVFASEAVAHSYMSMAYGVTKDTYKVIELFETR